MKIKLIAIRMLKCAFPLWEKCQSCEKNSVSFEFEFRLVFSYVKRRRLKLAYTIRSPCIGVYCAYDVLDLAHKQTHMHTHSWKKHVQFFPYDIFRINVFLIWLVLMISTEANTQTTCTHTNAHRNRLGIAWHSIASVKNICMYVLASMLIHGL